MTARDLGSDVSGSMVERVRAAILAAIGDKVLLDEGGETLIDGYVDAAAVARAAIEAMREPTPVMIDAAAVALEDTSFGEGRDYDLIRFVAEDIVRAALAPQPPLQQT